MTLILKKTPFHIFKKQLAEIALIQSVSRDLEQHNVVKVNRKTHLLHKSYIVFLVAVWQQYHVSFARQSFHVLISAEPPSIFHKKLIVDIENTIKRFNSPNRENIDKLFEAATGIEKISNSWVWEEMSNTQVNIQLKNLIEKRHEIAHTTRSSTTVSYKDNFDYMEFLLKLADLTYQVVDKHIMEVTGKTFLEH